MPTLRVTILGCGSSGGVPRATGDWGACDPNEPKNRRSRSCVLFQQWRDVAGDPRDATTALIDTSPDLRHQLAAARPHHIDAVLFSHDHADQTHGIDDVRAYVLKQERAITAFMDEATGATLRARFDYCFGGRGGYPPLFSTPRILRPFERVTVEGPGGPLTLTPIDQDHGFTHSLGFRAGPISYNNDVVALSERSFAELEGLQLWIVDALREKPHPTHAHLALTLEWIARLKPAHAVLTNLNHDVDYQALRGKLPADIEPAYDGWRRDVAL